MKKVKVTRIAVLLLVCFCLAQAVAPALSVPVFANSPFVIENGVLTQYNGNDANITIPSTVREIDSRVFEDMTFIQSVTIPSSVKKIGNSAFSGCTGLRNAKFSEGLNTIGAGAFRGCIGLQLVSLPASLTSIGSSAFLNCIGLRTLYLKSNIRLEIGFSAFSGCGLTGLTLPSVTNYVGEGAFENNTSLATLNLPAGISGIQVDAFRDCTSLKKVDLPGSIGTIPAAMFANCTSLETVVIRPGITKIDNSEFWHPGAFVGCTNLKRVTLPASLTFIGSGAFRDTPSLTSVAIPHSVTVIGDYAFDSGQHLLIKGQIGSRAQTFAAENNNRFQGTLAPVGYINVKRLTGNRLQITWPDVPGATNYKVRVKAGSGNYVDTYRNNTNLTINVQPYTLYTILVYGLASVNGVTIASADSPTRRVVSTVPPPPTNFVGRSPSPTRMRLTWTPENDAEFYLIFRRMGNRYVQVAKMTGTSRVFTDTKLTPYTQYDYKIESIRTVDGVTVRSSPVYRKKVRTQFIFGPTDIKTTANPGRQIRITWTRPTHYTGFRIFRKDLTTGKWSFVASTKNAFYTDTGLIAGRRYQYQIDTYLVDGNRTVHSKRSSSYYVTAKR